MGRPKKTIEPIAGADAAQPTGVVSGQCDDCPLVGVLLAYFTDKYGNDARPKIIKDLNALLGKE